MKPVKWTCLILIFSAVIFVMTSNDLFAEGDTQASHSSNDVDTTDLIKDDLGMVWSKPGLDLKQYDAIIVERPDISKLPTPAKFDYDTYARTFQMNLVAQIKLGKLFKDVYTFKDSDLAGKKVLLLKSQIEELNPGSAAARFWIGFGAGKAAVGIKSMLLESKDGTEASGILMKWYGRKLGISSSNSMAMLDKGTIGLAQLLYSYIDRLYKDGK